MLVLAVLRLLSLARYESLWRHMVQNYPAYLYSVGCGPNLFETMWAYHGDTLH
jgi:hypothetical protein